MKKNILVIIIIIFTLSFTVKAESYQIEGIEEIENGLTEDAKDFFDEKGISPDSTDWLSELDSKNAFLHIINFIKSGAKSPIIAGSGTLCLILISSAIAAISSDSEISKSAINICSISIGGFLSLRIYYCISTAVYSIKACSSFMLSFIPVFAGISTVSGAAATSVATSGMLIAAAEAVSMIASFVVIPCMGAYLSLSLCSFASPLIKSNQIGESIKKIALWILSLASTLFLGILSIQTAVNSAADSLALRTSKFIIGTAVPIAGPAISEAAATVTASIGILKASAGIYGILALAIIMLPIIIELLLWRAVLMVLSIISELLESGKIMGIFKAFDSMLALLIGITIFIAALFIISLTVVMRAGKTV